jgi:hypothetical protein
MSARLSGVVFVVLLVAFTFGILTLWIQELWPWAVFQSVVLIATALCLFVGVEKISAWLLLPLSIALIGALQIAFSRTVDGWETRRTVFEWLTYASGAFLAFVVCREPHLRARALRLFAVSAAVLALLSTIQNYSSPGRVLWLFDSGYTDIVFGPFVYHTKLANFAELAIPVAVWLASAEKRRRGLHLGCAVVLAGSVVASASRGGILVLALEAVVLGAISQARRPVPLAIGLFGILICTSAVFGWELAAHRFASIDPAEDLRWSLAATSVEMARRYWLTGCGLGTWSLVYPEFARFDLHLFINQAHSDWLQWLDEGGIWFPVVMGGMLALALKAARREWWTLGLVFVWLHGVADYPMQQTPAFACLQIAFWGAAVAVNGNLGRAVAVRRN